MKAMKLGRALSLIMALIMLVAVMPHIQGADLLSATQAQEADGTATGELKAIHGYFVGNSLTTSISPERLTALFKAQGYKLTFDQQNAGGITLAEHVGVKNAETGEFTPYSLISKGPFAKGDNYFTSMASKQYDFVSLQLYANHLNTPAQYKDCTTTPKTDIKGLDGAYYEYYRQGDIQTLETMIDYALEQRKNGCGTDTFIVYQTWFNLEGLEAHKVDTDGNGIYTYSEFWEAEYTTQGTAVNTAPNQQTTDLLMEALRSRYADEDVNIILVSAGEILSVLDKKIKAGALPGFEGYMARNNDYYLKSRGTGTDLNLDGDYDDPGESSEPGKAVPPELAKKAYIQEYGILCIYNDQIHLSAYPHAGANDGTLGSYITAVALFTAITGESAQGVVINTGASSNMGRYTRLDATEDAELVAEIQKVIDDVHSVNNP